MLNSMKLVVAFAAVCQYFGLALIDHLFRYFFSMIGRTKAWWYFLAIHNQVISIIPMTSIKEWNRWLIINSKESFDFLIRYSKA